MGYVEKHLLPNEKIILKAQVHWTVFITWIMSVVTATFAAFIFWFVFVVSKYSFYDGYLLYYLLHLSTSHYEIHHVLIFYDTLGFTILLFLSCQILIARSVSRYFFTDFARTHRRVIATTGMLRQRSLRLMLTKV